MFYGSSSMYCHITRHRPNVHFAGRGPFHSILSARTARPITLVLLSRVVRLATQFSRYAMYNLLAYFVSRINGYILVVVALVIANGSALIGTVLGSGVPFTQLCKYKAFCAYLPLSICLPF